MAMKLPEGTFRWRFDHYFGMVRAWHMFWYHGNKEVDRELRMMFNAHSVVKLRISPLPEQNRHTCIRLVV